MTKRDGARRFVLTALLPGAALALAGVSEADFIFHVANYTYLHEEELPLYNRLCSGDFNGDEKPDFVMGSYVSFTDGYLEVFLGNSDGTFEAMDHVATKEIWAWVVGDFDNNGIDDVLIKDFDGYTMSDTAMCYLSVGDGQFADPIDVPGFLWQVAGDSRHTDIDDYDMDGSPDIALTSFDSVEVYLGAGDGTFTRSWGMSTPDGCSCSVESSDLDNDGIPDLITLAIGCFLTHFGNGDGTFGEPSWYSVDGPSPIGDVCCGDINEDGWIDIGITAGLGVGTNTLFIFLNEGDGSFPAYPSSEYNLGGHQFFDIYFEDLDLDGHLDLGLAGGGGVEEAIILPGKGDGTFDTSLPLWYVVGFGETEYAWADFDNDGDPDIAIARRDSSTQFPSGIYVIPNETIQEGVEGGEHLPGVPTLKPSCNPFTSSVTITCESETLPGQLMVYDITGRLIRTLNDPEGSSFLWDGRGCSGGEVPVGAYLIRGAVDGRASSIMVVRL